MGAAKQRSFAAYCGWRQAVFVMKPFPAPISKPSSGEGGGPPPLLKRGIQDVLFDEYGFIVDFYLIISAMSSATIIMAAIIRGVWAPFLFFACVNSASSWEQRFRESESISE